MDHLRSASPLRKIIVTNMTVELLKINIPQVNFQSAAIYILQEDYFRLNALSKRQKETRTESAPTALNGVSQQPPAQRHATVSFKRATMYNPVLCG